MVAAGISTDHVLLERDVPLRALEGYAAEAREGIGHFVLVRGEAGIGKTALVRELVRSLPPTVRVAAGACDGVSTVRPFGPLNDMVATLGHELRDLLDAGAPRARISRWMLDHLSIGPAVVLVVEDIQWADDATLELLLHLARRIEGRPVLVVVTARDGDGPTPALERTLGSLATVPTVRHIVLEGLSPDAVARLVDGSRYDPKAIYRLTSGNPFYVWEVIQAHGEAIPVSVRDAIRARLSELDGRGRRALEAAAIVGRAEPWLLSAAAGEDILGIDDCVAAGILVHSDGIRFRHELTRMTVLDDLPPFRAIGLHRRALEALQRSRSGDLARLAYHAEGAADPASVLEFAPSAARRALAMGAVHESIAQLERAFRFADGIDPAIRADLLGVLARALYLVNDASRAYEASAEAVALRRRADDSLKLGDELRAHVLIAWAAERGEEAWRAAREATDLLEPLGDSRELALACAIRGRLGVSAGRIHDARHWSERALEMGRRIGEPEPVTIALASIGTMALCEGDDAGRGLLVEALEIGRAADLPEAVDRALNNLGACAFDARQFESAERHFRAYEENSERSEIERCSVDAARAEIAERLGRWEEAEGHARRALVAPRTDPIDRALALIVLARLAVRRKTGDHGRLLREPTDIAARLGSHQVHWPLVALEAEMAWTSGDLRSAIAPLERVYREAVEARAPWAIGEFGRWLARAHALDALDDHAAEPYRLEVDGNYRAAAAEWERLEMPFEAAVALAGSADPVDLRRAHRAFARLGADATVGAATRALQALGAAVPRGPRQTTSANPDGLTEREAEVAQLLAEGLSNAQIARQLVVSEKTVGHHVSAVLAKLGIRSRSGVARTLARIN